ncbi:MAG: thermonuclease family protein [Nitrospirota bacterium]
MARAISQRHPVRAVLVAVILAVLVSPSLGAQGRELTGQVVGVSDGDTITVRSGRQTVKVRLAGIDCPEKRQAFGARAKQFTSQRAFDQTVTIIPVDVDRYGRLVGEVILPNGESLNRALVAAGLAWWYRKYSDDEDLEQLEEEARQAERGLWADADPIPPWEFRRLVRQGR